MGHANANLLYLRDALLKQDTWPKWFTWNFRYLFQRGRGKDNETRIHECGSVGCAIGLASTIWPDEFKLSCWEGGELVNAREVDEERAAAFLGLDRFTFHSLFMSTAKYYPHYASQITTEMVVEAITHYDSNGTLINFKLKDYPRV